MALGDNYITMQELKDYMGNFTDTTYDTALTRVTGAVSREVEDWCHRQFNQAGATSQRVYRPKDRNTCMVDDFFTTTGLVIETDEDDDGTFETTWTAGVDYELRPLNGVRNGLPGWPYWEIHAVGYARRFHWSPMQRANVRVTANWGWANVPAPVKEACLMLGSDTFQLKDSRMGIAGSDQFGTVVRVRDSVVAQSKLRHYCREKVFVR